MKKKLPTDDGLRDFFSHLPLPNWHPNADLLWQAHIAKQAEMDISIRLKWRKIEKGLFYFIQSRMRCGSGFRMANLLRHYFLEYTSRLIKHGPFSFPTSFNVAEAFFTFHKEFLTFDILPEKEYLLRIDDYFDWYTSEQVLANDIKILTSCMQENQIYSYDMADDPDAVTVSTESSQLVIAGISLIRRENELAVILLGGENPPYPPDQKILDPKVVPGSVPLGKEELTPADDLTVKDRYLDGLKGYGKVVLLTRLNLDSKTHDVRYLNIDVGKSYLVYTDDLSNLGDDLSDMTDEARNEYLKRIQRYEQLFSTLLSLVYLPLYFVDQQSRVAETRFATEIATESQKHEVKKAFKEIGKSYFTFHRTITCMTTSADANRTKFTTRQIDPPSFTFESSGYWKVIGPNEIGEDAAKNPVVGKTWVERIEKYTVKSPSSFTLRENKKRTTGKDPGVVYIMRSPSHGLDVYKVGLTRRAVQDRAAELSSATGVPLPLEVLASWETSDCTSVETEVHKRLKQFRLNKRREFFGITLSTLVSVIGEVIAECNTQ